MLTFLASGLWSVRMNRTSLRSSTRQTAWTWQAAGPWPRGRQAQAGRVRESAVGQADHKQEESGARPVERTPKENIYLAQHRSRLTWSSLRAILI